MFRKTKIFSLILLFFISTTGLPAFYHYCEMLDKKTLNECDMCSQEKEENYSCCSEEVAENFVKLTSENSTCCQDKFVYNKVQDEFLFNKYDINSFISVEKLIQTTFLIPISIDFYSENSFYCDSSPPFLINPEIHITNSSLLI